ncbi:hypothetical protein BB559_007005 [Furculomyces boomerangus]|uniref:J domain-containing protein n=2 Tax=Harpellales TaxID=61421 RepID=A0A2T9XZH7_9FUNG|nr:hypothetical protein BB559_007005 [Furculomyces boomerangus]PWA01241.1 hypothetical protein BB558_002682 [Smittium angustum]
MSTDYYDLLGVDKNASYEEIRRAYMLKALEYHPDRNDSPDAKAVFHELAEAYFTLSNEKRRKDYDNLYGGEKLLRPEVEKETSLWRNLGAISGGVLGFIVANVPGAIGGAFAGRSLGTIRDKKGKSVMEAFQSLPYSNRLQVLSNIAMNLIATQAIK